MGQIKNIKLHIVTDIKFKSTLNSSIMTVAAPVVKWAQRKDILMVSIELSEVTDEKIDITEDQMTFTGKSGGKDYATTIEFNKKVKPEEDKTIKVCGREIYCQLKKEEGGPFWPRLEKVKGKTPNVKADFGRWKDEDDSDDETPPGARGMGGGQFDPDEGCSTDDSDDEDIPDLEEGDAAL